MYLTVTSNFYNNKSILIYLVGVCLGFLGGFVGSLVWVYGVLWGFSSLFLQ
jgi:hypothetical protein